MKSAIFAVSLCAISGAAVTGCSAAGKGSEPNGNRDGSVPPGLPDASYDAKLVNPGMLAPNVFLVNAAAGLGDVRFCFEANDEPAVPDDVTVPSTSYPGLATGGAALFRRAFAIRGKPLNGAVAMVAADLGAAEYGRPPFKCSELSKNNLFVKIPIRPVTPKLLGAAVLALVGCPPGTGTPQACGSSFDIAKGNLELLEVDLSGVSLNQPRAFATNLSPSLADKVGMAVVDGFVAFLAAPCSGTRIAPAFKLAPLGDAVPATDFPAPSAYDARGFTVCRASTPVVKSSYTAMQRATDPTSVPDEHFAKLAAYVFAMVGDTSVAEGPEALHVLSIPFEAAK